MSASGLPKKRARSTTARPTRTRSTARPARKSRANWRKKASPSGGFRGFLRPTPSDHRSAPLREQHVIDRQVVRFAPVAAAPVVAQAAEFGRAEPGAAQAENKFGRAHQT